MESLAVGYDVSHAPFGWTKSYNVKVKGHPLAEKLKDHRQRICGGNAFPRRPHAR
ncbi:threonyl-tRNA synthetase editing domain-containing protein [Candidatus Nitrosotenuis chungbukensis]|uniref:threonyl-tRNA synthetase editing domain-containing protein n=1 Tax=Candidatus Nitrosotenuis chungbukensis TaxID=1353246 RepID=UPI002671A416|nr:threonyl-tRNA synthetase editing domain-containing protein [Candidatus Nitrosotenuis chungbukensis]WKT57584.1 threonyl-tRNA synthetase editing domain-containing protein [Candidatus Nitrosotenuis chungbukensis]